jgi:RNA polymerase sigma-70 factor (ECF subfamily)
VYACPIADVRVERKNIVKDPDDLNGVERRGSYLSTSWSLLDRVKQGEPEGWRRLVYLYSPVVRARCRRQGVTGAGADDIVQEVLKTVWEKIGDFQKQPGPSFRSWLKTITKYKLGDYFRRSREEPRGVGGTDAQRGLGQIPNDADEAFVDDPADEVSDRRLLVRQALRLVSSDFEPRSWQAVWLVVVENRSPADVAAELRMTPNAVYVAKSRILSRLRDVLADLGESAFGADPLAASAREIER